MSAFLQIFQLTLGQKNAKSPWCTDSMPWWHNMAWATETYVASIYISLCLVATFVDICFSLTRSRLDSLLKSGHEKLRARVLVNSFSMGKSTQSDTSRGRITVRLTSRLTGLDLTKQINQEYNHFNVSLNYGLKKFFGIEPWSSRLWFRNGFNRRSFSILESFS